MLSYLGSARIILNMILNNHIKYFVYIHIYSPMLQQVFVATVIDFKHNLYLFIIILFIYIFVYLFSYLFIFVFTYLLINFFYLLTYLFIYWRHELRHVL